MAKIKIPFNLIIIIFLVFALIGLYWLDRLGLSAGSAYLWLFVIGVIFIVITMIAKAIGTDFWFEIPINKSNDAALVMLFAGFMLLFVMNIVPKILGLSFYSPFVMSPLASFSNSIGAETFSALSAVTSPFWVFFITVLSASVIEEIVLGWAFVTMGSLLLGKGLRLLMKIDYGKEGNEVWDFIMAMVFSIIMFTVLHSFNNTYINADGTWNVGFFMFAAVFRAVLNILIYRFGHFGLMFSIGVHAANNALFVGSATTLAALTTFPAGIILDALIFLFAIYTILSLDSIIVAIKNYSKDFITFE